MCRYFVPLILAGVLPWHTGARSIRQPGEYLAFGSNRIFAGRVLRATAAEKKICRKAHDIEDSDEPKGTYQRGATEGLYRKFADHASEKLLQSGLFQTADIPEGLQEQVANAKGAKDSIVRMTNIAMVPSVGSECVVRYARVALLETISQSSEDSVQSNGIQVLNFAVFPSNSTSLPVLGIDLVSLPGNKNLLLLDAQPMAQPNPFEDNWSRWHEVFVDENPYFPWGGDFPEPVQQYVSKYALWTRLQEQDDPASIIQNQVWDAFVGHLELYLDLLRDCSNNLEKARGGNHQPKYLDYRRNNDPAKPMLNSLYGAEWTERVLDEVLFPL